MASFHNYVKLPVGIFALLPGSMYHVHHRMPLVSSNMAHWEMPLVVLMRKSIVQVGGTGPSRSYGWTRLSPHIVSLIVVKWSEEQQWLIPSRDHYSFDSEKGTVTQWHTTRHCVFICLCGYESERQPTSRNMFLHEFIRQIIGSSRWDDAPS
jgi:hypothetical protein